jgi:tRNA dimethylallyltransferase
VPDSIRIPIICGPTASGKTSAALELAARLPIEVVSADSRQLVKRLNIGTAKPTPEEQAKVSFHLIDLIDPGERYSAFRYIDDATTVIKGILNRDHLPVIVGGTGLYLRALTDGVVEMEADDMGTRERLEKEMIELGPEVMYERLRETDPLEASRIHPNNKVRVIRAIEIFCITGKTKSELAATGTHRKSPYSFEYFCLAPPREKLYGIINARVDSMIKSGLMDEIKSLVDAGLKDAVRKSNIIGYNELLDYLDGRYTIEEATSMIKQNSRRYAKRQVTWFRHQVDCQFFDTPSRLIEAILCRSD